jgi:hypothetical protein
MGNPDRTILGEWDLMSNAMDPSQSISAWAKATFTDWTAPLPTIVANGTYTLYPLSTHRHGHAFRLNSPVSETEYFVVEYRNKDVGYTDSGLPGSGLLIYRVNTLVEPLFLGNSEGPPDMLYLYRPFGTLTNVGDINNAYFSFQSGRTEINAHTDTRPFLANGQLGGLNLSNIGYAGDTITFSVNMVNLPTPVFPPSNLAIAYYGNDIVLSWEDPEIVDPISTNNIFIYKIYRNGKLVTSNPIAERFYHDFDLDDGTYLYAVTAIIDGHESVPSTTTATIPFVSDIDVSLQPPKDELFANFPNPFNPETTISFNLAVASTVSIDIYNIRGQRVRRLLNGSMDSGEHCVVWNGLDDHGRDVGSGVYFYQLSTPSYWSVQRMVILH